MPRRSGTYSGPTPEQQAEYDKAVALIKLARTYVPQWRAFARVLTRNPKLKLELSAGTSMTDGDTIWLRIPPELADQAKHDRSLCGKRDELSIMLCPACQVRDTVNSHSIHEIGHITQGSFDAIQDRDAALATAKAIQYHVKDGNTEREAAIRDRMEKALESGKITNYLTLASLVSPYLPTLLNAIEDMRVNAAMIQARPGCRVMFQALYNGIFERGIRNYDGTTTWWADAPSNLQVSIGVYCLVSELDYRRWLADDVCDALEDPRIIDLAEQVKEAHDVRSLYNLVFPLLEAFRDLGFFLDPDDESESDDSQQDGDSQGQGANPSSPFGDTPSPGAEGDQSNDDQEGANDQSDASEGQTGSGSGDGAGSAPSPDDSEPSSGGSAESDGLGGSADGSPASGSVGGDFTGDESDASGPGDTPSRASQGTGEGTGEQGASGRQNVTREQQEAMGSPRLVETGMQVFGGHSDELEHQEGDDETTTNVVLGEQERLSEEKAEQEKKLVEALGELGSDLLLRVFNQYMHFGKYSTYVDGVTIINRAKMPEHDMWQDHSWYTADKVTLNERVLAPALNHLRLVFTANKARSKQRNLKRGRVATKTLGRRAPVGDERIFQKKQIPTERKHFVVIGLDVSGSTGSYIRSSNPDDDAHAIDLLKSSARHMGELLDRLGVDFCIYAHSSDGTMAMFEIKASGERWTDFQRDSLDLLRPYGGNLDGHTLEFYINRALEVNAQSRTVFYFTDGAMPMENYDEELDVLETQIKRAAQSGVNLVGIGIGTDSPKEHGMDTLQLDAIEDMVKVVQELKRRID